jgi:hypothetical protein
MALPDRSLGGDHRDAAGAGVVQADGHLPASSTDIWR